MKTLALLGTTLGLSFTAGLNLYATVLMTGLAVRMGWVQLPPGLEGLSALAHPVVLGVAGLLSVVEFLADKIPAVDHVWDAVHTFVRPLGAVLITWTAASGTNMSQALEVPLLLLEGGVSLSTHAGTAGTRLASSGHGAHAVGGGIGLSLLEDVAAFSIAPLALAYPEAALVVVVVVVGLGLLAVVAPLGWRLLPSRLAAFVYLRPHKVVGRQLPGLDTSHLAESVTLAFAENGVLPGEEGLILPGCVSSLPGIPRWAPDFVAVVPGGAVFACRGWLRTRLARVSWADGEPVLVPRLTGYVLHIRTPKRRATFTFFPLTAPMGRALELGRWNGRWHEKARGSPGPSRDPGISLERNWSSGETTDGGANRLSPRLRAECPCTGSPRGDVTLARVLRSSTAGPRGATSPAESSWRRLVPGKSRTGLEVTWKTGCCGESASWWRFRGSLPFRWRRSRCLLPRSATGH